ncbi:ABC transporter substrate-binding protein [Trujillonella endophytica]|uniref:ABC-type nitrate/sulfonate/bicarbonate transport system, substrate-binding protein n=1 Tax=Trujillonella endophytica TaxID=673521 RepID=A0A1H8TKE3_9ACTN|nr:ABC transporter substrate-binding protein [Trujillella endophytica]SEO91540.1 ABC-type nitrate/sulfonate/bicarbonate transport system, substrate-binding protein [Trujillella endophytica]
MRARPVLAALAAATVLVGATACGSSDEVRTAADGTVTLRYQGWANQVTLPELAEHLGYLEGVGLEWAGNTTSGPQDIQAAASGAVEFGGAFDGAVAKLATSGAPVTAVVAYYGSDADAYNGFYVLEDSPIADARDLIGKKVGVNTLGGHNEAVIDTWLLEEGLSWEEVQQVQLVPLPPPNIDSALRHGQIDVAALSGQFRDQTLATGGVRALFTDSEIFGDFNAGTYVFRDDFIAEYPEAVEAFVDGVARAIEWTRTTPHDEIIATYTTIIEQRNRNESTDSLQYWRSTGVATEGGVIEDTDFTRWSAWLERTGALDEGGLDPGSIYTNEYNPYATDGDA